ncbi:hypothetical protein RSW31_24480, partial [Escherichia coli]|uniref:hypothetical protein n=1 Tax=Escherichia coli TaxID=562 RepID=UPI0028DEB6B9
MPDRKLGRAAEIATTGSALPVQGTRKLRGEAGSERLLQLGGWDRQLRQMPAADPRTHSAEAHLMPAAA